MSIEMTFPGKLRAWREKNEFTQAHCAELAEVSTATWSDWESGKKVPTADRGQKLEEITRGDVTLNDVAEYARSERESRAARRDALRHG